MPEYESAQKNLKFLQKIKNNKKLHEPEGQVQQRTRRAHTGACRGLGGPRPQVAPAPQKRPGAILWTTYSSRRENPNPQRIFPNTQQSSAAIADKFRGSDWSCSGTLPEGGSTAGAIPIDTAAFRDEEGVVPHRGWGLYK